MIARLNNRILKIIFAFTLIVNVAGFFLINNSTEFLYKSVSILLTLFWLVILYKHSTIQKTIYSRIMLLLAAALIVGLLFKLQHWADASLILIISISGLMVTYMIRFLMKKHKALLDVLKMVWFETLSGIYLGILQHWIMKEYSIISNILFLFMIGALCLSEGRKAFKIEYE